MRDVTCNGFGCMKRDGFMSKNTFRFDMKNHAFRKDVIHTSILASGRIPFWQIGCKTIRIDPCLSSLQVMRRIVLFSPMYARLSIRTHVSLDTFEVRGWKSVGNDRVGFQFDCFDLETVCLDASCTFSRSFRTFGWNRIRSCAKRISFSFAMSKDVMWRFRSRSWRNDDVSDPWNPTKTFVFLFRSSMHRKREA